MGAAQRASDVPAHGDASAHWSAEIERLRPARERTSAGVRSRVGRAHRFDPIAQLVSAPLFAAMPAAVVATLAGRSTRKQVKKGARVLSRGDRASVVLLVTGRLEVVADHADEVTLVRSLLPPAVVGLSVAAGALPSAELWAAEACELVVVPADDVAAALKKHPEAAVRDRASERGEGDRRAVVGGRGAAGPRPRRADPPPARAPRAGSPGGRDHPRAARRGGRGHPRQRLAGPRPARTRRDLQRRRGRIELRGSR